MNILWSNRFIQDAAGNRHAAAAFGCPRCGRVTLVEFAVPNHPSTSGTTINAQAEVSEILVLPDAQDLGLSVRHLPDDVDGFYLDAQRVLLAGVPDAAAVQLRKTLEAAAAHKGSKESTLFKSVKKLMDDGYLTQDFSRVMDHIRKIGNAGAHYTDVKLTAPEVERSLRFTTQVLRNLFEVPGELEELASESKGTTPDEFADE